jgi:hypothetical protein
MSRIRAEFHDPDGDRYGLPTYWWQGAPEGYATHRQLRARGLRPGRQPIAAQILWAGVGGIRTAYLYRTDLARPKRTATPAQLAAVGEALRARRTCRACGIERPYYIRRSLGQCGTCNDTPAPARPRPSTSHTREAHTLPGNDLLTTALSHAERGWHVFPLRPDDKRPAVRDWEQRATTDPDRIRRCWTAGPYGIGIACGPSKLVVVDLDTRKPDQDPPAGWAMEGVNDGGDVLAVLANQAGQPYPAETYTVTTGRGGTHLYFRHPTGGQRLHNTAGTRGNGLGWLIDTRACGGYVVAPGSTANGRPYVVAYDVPVGELPAWLADRLAPAPLPPQHPVVVDLPFGRHSAYVEAAINRQLAYLRQATQGSRNHALYVSAVALGQLAAGGALSTDQAEAVLELVAFEVGLNPCEVDATIRSGLRAGARRPRKVAA